MFSMNNNWSSVDASDNYFIENIHHQFLTTSEYFQNFFATFSKLKFFCNISWPSGIQLLPQQLYLKHFHIFSHRQRQGLQYIHNSPLKSHGALRSSNCLVDGRWVLKVSNYGLDKFRDQKKVDGTSDDVGEYQFYRKQVDQHIINISESYHALEPSSYQRTHVTYFCSKSFQSQTCPEYYRLYTTCLYFKCNFLCKMFKTIDLNTTTLPVPYGVNTRNYTPEP